MPENTGDTGFIVHKTKMPTKYRWNLHSEIGLN